MTKKLKKRCRDLERTVEAYRDAYDENVERLADIANDMYVGAYNILDGWEPTKQGGLAKKESRAAFAGFALGVIAATGGIVTATKMRDKDGEPGVYQWLCSMVAMYRDDRDAFFSKLADYIAGQLDVPDDDWDETFVTFLRLFDETLED